tara:strand:+ start:291 stop:401 length:111 start_codon:yes stop_codon:yes gene_type:complete
MQQVERLLSQVNLETQELLVLEMQVEETLNHLEQLT